MDASAAAGPQRMTGIRPGPGLARRRRIPDAPSVDAHHPAPPPRHSDTSTLFRVGRLAFAVLMAISLVAGCAVRWRGHDAAVAGRPSGKTVLIP
jgi:hypothetical protein